MYFLCLMNRRPPLRHLTTHTFPYTTLFGLVHRAGRGDPVVLRTGNGHSAQEFDRVLPALASRFTLIGWDMPGHGASSQADAGLSIDDRAAVLGEILARPVEGPAVLVGNSIGAFVAAALAARTPGRVQALPLAELQIPPAPRGDAARPPAPSGCG